MDITNPSLGIFNTLRALATNANGKSGLNGILIGIIHFNMFIPCSMSVS